MHASSDELRAMKISDYVTAFDSIENVLNRFVQDARIDHSQLALFDRIIDRSSEDEVRILNNSYISLNEQRALFGAFRNIKISTKMMKNRLENACKFHENPTTVEIALEIIPIYQNLSRYLDDFLDRKEIYELDKICLFSRSLYKKSKQLGFSQDTSSQLKEIGISPELVGEFVEEFTVNVSKELELDEEIGFQDESAN